MNKIHFLLLIFVDFWCLNSESIEDNYILLQDNHAIRITRTEWVIPNVEIRFISNELDELALKNKITVITPSFELDVSRPELQIPYKRYVLGSDKDIEDAIHLEEVFRNQLDGELLKKCQEFIQNELQEE